MRYVFSRVPTLRIKFLCMFALVWPIISNSYDSSHLQQVLNRENCQNCDLSGSNLHKADLSGLNLSGTNFTGADLSEASLRYSVLEGGDLKGVNLAGANLRRANLRTVENSGSNLSFILFIALIYRV